MVATKVTKKIGAPRNVASYLAAPYVRMLVPNAEDGGYLAEVLELPGCISEGETLEQAYQNVEEAMAGWIGAMLDSDRPIPEPVGAKEYSGSFPLRLSTELHRAAALRAIQEEVSLNQWIARAIAAQVTKESLVDNLADQVAGKVLEGIRIQVEAGFRMQLGGLEMVEPARASDSIRTGVKTTTEKALTETLADNFTHLEAEIQDVIRYWELVDDTKKREELAKDA